MKIAIFLLLFPMAVVTAWHIERSRILLREVMDLKRAHARFRDAVANDLNDPSLTESAAATNIDWLPHDQWRQVEIGFRGDGVVVWRKTPGQ